MTRKREEHARQIVQGYDPCLAPPEEMQEALQLQTPLGVAEFQQALQMSNAVHLPFNPVPDRPTINVELSTKTVDNRRTVMEDHAIEIREYMCDLRRPTAIRWPVAHQSAEPADYLALPQGSLPHLQEDAKPIGLPIPEAHRNHLRRLAYATSVKQTSSLSATVMINSTDYKCIKFSTAVTESEAKCLGAITGKGPDRILGMCTQSKDHKEPWGAAVASCIAPRSTLKTGMAIGSANEAVTSAGQEAKEESVKARRLLATVSTNLLRAFPDDLDQNSTVIQSLRNIRESMSKIERRMETVSHASKYITEAAMTVTDVSVRGLRTGLQQCRSNCTRAVFSLDSGQKRSEKQAKAMELTCLEQPYVPTSLFGGRLPHALHELRHRQKDFAEMNQTVRELGGGHMPKFDLVAKQDQPFRRAPRYPKKKAWSNKRKGFQDRGRQQGGKGGGQQQQQQRQKQQQQQRSTKPPPYKKKRSGGGGGAGGGKPGANTNQGKAGGGGQGAQS